MSTARDARPTRVTPAPLLERLGVDYLLRRSRGVSAVPAADAVHVLNAQERAELGRIQRGAVIRAALAGALSAAVSATAEVSWGWTSPAFVAMTLIATAFELAFLYWDGLRSVHRLAVAAGLSLFPDGPAQERAGVAAALARAALELPNPHPNYLGVDPYRDASRLYLIASSIIYKLKIGLTSFVLKALLRRLLGRSALRAWLTFVSVPVTAGWNAAVSWLVLREARLRAMGPSAAVELLDAALGGPVSLSDEARRTAIRAAVCAVVGKRDMHPNLAGLLQALHTRLDSPKVEASDDKTIFLRDLSRLAPPEQRVVVRILTAASVMDGRLARRDRELLAAALVACGLTPDVGPARALRRAFVAGDDLAAVTASWRE